MRFSAIASFSWFLFGAAFASGEESRSTCDELAFILPNSTFYPEAPAYNASISSYPFLQLRLHPSCIIRPKSARDVSQAISVLKDSNCTRFAVKGGGHNANAGFNNIQNGVTIDMQSLNDVEVARGDKVVRVSAGALWQKVYDTAEKRNLTVLGGRIGVVGTAGFLTGGGISFFSPEHGWACDAVVNFEVVLASGEIVNANATSQPDLYAALKGGQSNFGIVTRFDLKAFPATTIWGGRTVYHPNATIPLLTAFTEFKSGEYDPYAAGWVTVRYNHTAATFNPVSIMWYTKPAQKPGALKSILEVKPQIMNGRVEAPVSEHTRNASRMVVADPKRTIWATTSFSISPTIVHRIHALWKEVVPEVAKQYAYAKPVAEITFQALPAPPRNGTSPNSLGFTAAETPEKDLVFLQIIFTFDDEAATEGFEEALKDFLKLIEGLAKDEGVLHRYKYLNFAASFQDPLASYGQEQKDTLREVAEKYDPEGVFQKQVPGGFKLF
ncbi:FAD-binding domain-containing protein [Cucurbitaria berberidis CBS 394.84]|uniref:FAD-binding domain-containing protein n=1 Tax=Cucurbitaria berberidis CBS 394.84 TaxID=1168544 RepID=A0A9P4GJQ7_9PLEO|nr:FAD-binding domain-containing protein [Cucurbitaria berberidis CBS 394.84]KAF1846474.1 FAD-binding domain-containing protein [Cucurbitaria berberidis CBS 394.84]